MQGSPEQKVVELRGIWKLNVYLVRGKGYSTFPEVGLHIAFSPNKVSEAFTRATSFSRDVGQHKDGPDPIMQDEHTLKLASVFVTVVTLCTGRQHCVTWEESLGSNVGLAARIR
jgi:hypothetical protein